ncbi:uncharacterized protein LOC135366660 [Ornithodoros turicata]|uniref:uncharacterized protein LOC135366660 n=1 Tax=Ornithodoros turicata TaxID=34597 RepID=UPI003138FCA7
MHSAVIKHNRSKDRPKEVLGMDDGDRNASSPDSSHLSASDSALTSDESGHSESTSRYTGVREEGMEHDSECEVMIERRLAPAPVHNTALCAAHGLSSADAIPMQTSYTSSPSVDENVQDDASGTPAMATGGACESGPAEAEHVSAVPGFWELPHEAMASSTLVAQGERLLERFVAERASQHDHDELAQGAIIPALNSLEEDLKLGPMYIGGGGEQILPDKTAGIDALKGDTVGNVADCLHMYPVYETHPSWPDAELDYADSFAVAENKIAATNKKLNAIGRETAESDEYFDYDVQRTSRSPRSARPTKKKHKSPSSKQSGKGQPSPQVVDMVKDAVDSLMEEFQLENESDLEREHPPVGYDSPPPRIKVIRTSIEDLDNVETICSLLESLTGDVKGDIDPSKIQPIVLEASYFDETEDDAEKRSPKRKKCSKKAKSNSLELVHISRKKKKGSCNKASRSSRKNEHDDVEMEEVTLTEVSEGDDGDESKNKKVRFFTNLVLRRKKMPSGVTLSAKDGKGMPVVKKAGSSSGKGKCAASDESRSSTASRGSMDSWRSRRSAGSAGSTAIKVVRKLIQAEQASKGKKKTDAKKQERKKGVNDASGKVVNVTPGEEGQETKGTRKECSKKKRGTNKTPKAKKKGDDEEEGIRIKRDSGGGIRLILPRTASVNIDSTGSHERRERQLCDKCSEEAVAKKRTQSSDRTKEAGEKQKRDSSLHQGDVASYIHRQFSFERRASPTPRDTGCSGKDADIIEMFESLYGRQRGSPNGRRGTEVNRSRGSSFDQRDSAEIRSQDSCYGQRESFGFHTRDISHDRVVADGSDLQDTHERRKWDTVKTSREQEESEPLYRSRSPPSRHGLGQLEEVEIELYNSRKPSRDRKLDMKGQKQIRSDHRGRPVSTISPPPVPPPPPLTPPPPPAYRRDLVDFTLRTLPSPLPSEVPPPPVPPPPPSVPPPDWSSSQVDLGQQSRPQTKRKKHKEVHVRRAKQTSPPRGEPQSAEILYRSRAKATSKEYKRPEEMRSRNATSSPGSPRGKCDIKSRSPARAYVTESNMGIRTKGAEDYKKEIEVDVRKRRAPRDSGKDFRSRKPQQECIRVSDTNIMSSQRQSQRSRQEEGNRRQYTPDGQQEDDRERRGLSRNRREGTPELKVETRYERRREISRGDDYVEGHTTSPGDDGRLRQPGRSTDNSADSLRGRSPSPSPWSTQGGPFKPHPSSEYEAGDTHKLGGSPSRESWSSSSDRSRKRDLPRDQRKDLTRSTRRSEVPAAEWGRMESTREEIDTYRSPKRGTGGAAWRRITSPSKEWHAGNRKDVRGNRSPRRSPSVITSRSDIEGTSYTGYTTQTGYSAEAGYRTATSHVESATNISRVMSPGSGSQSPISSNVDVRKRTAHHRGRSRGSPTAKPPNVGRSAKVGAQGIDLQIFPEEGLPSKIVLEREDHDKKQTFVVKTSKTDVKDGGSSEDVTRVTVNEVKKAKDKTKAPKKKEAQKKGSGSSSPLQYDGAKPKGEVDSIFKECAIGPRINVWHVPPGEMQKHLETVQPALSDIKRSRSGSRASESKRSGSRRSESSHSKRRTCRRELRRRRALETRPVAESPTVGYETIQGPIYETDGAHYRIEPCVEMRHRKTGHSLSMEQFNGREPASSALTGEQKQDPYTSTRRRRSSRTEIKRFASTEDQFGLPTIGLDTFRQQDVISGVPVPREMAPSIDPAFPQPWAEGMQGMPVQQTIIVPGSRGPPILTQSLGQSQIRPISLDAMKSGQTFLLQSQGGGQTILTQMLGPRMPNPQGNVNLQAQQPGLVGSHSATRITLTHGGGPHSVLPRQTAPPQSSLLSPGPTHTILIQPGSPPAEPQQFNLFQQDPKQQERITMFKRSMRYTFPSPPMSPPPMGPRFIAQAALTGSGAQSVRPSHHHYHPFGPPHWHQPAFAYRRSHGPQGMRSGFMAEEPTRRSPRNAFSQPAIHRPVGTPFTSHSFMTACESTQAPQNELLAGSEAAATTLASTSAPALDLGNSVSASCHYSQPSGSGENAYSLTISTESPSQSDDLDIWDRSKQRSIDPILPEAVRNSRTHPKGLRRFTNKGQTAVYLTLLVVVIAGLAGTISLYSKRRWAHEEEEETFEGGDGAKMFGPWQKFDDQGNASPNGTRSCVSLQCSPEALALIQSIDRSVNPCDDFYGHVCSSQWKAKGSYASADGIAKKEIQRAVVNFFKENSPGSGDIATSKQFWQGCVNVDEIAHLGNSPFLAILNMTGLRRWPYAVGDYDPDVADVWRKAGKIIRHMSLSPLLDVRVIPSLRRYKREIVLSRGEHIPAAQRNPQKDFGRDALAADVVKAFRTVHPSGSYDGQITTEVVDFIFKLSNISDGQATTRDGLTTVIKPFIHNAFGDEDTLPPNGSVYTTQNSRFVDAVVRLVQTTSSRITLNYLGFSVVHHAFLFSPSSAKEVLSLGKKTSAAVARESECVRALLNDALPKATAERVAYAAVQKHIDLAALRVLASDLKKSAVNRISKLHWMDTGTRARVARQLRETDIRFFFENDTGSDSLVQRHPPERVPEVLPAQALLSYQRLRAHRFKSTVATTTSAGVNYLGGSFTHEDCTYYSDQKVLLLPLSALDVRASPTPFSLLFQVPRFGVKVLRCLLRVLFSGSVDTPARTQSAVRESWTLPARRHYEKIRSCIDKQYLRIRDPVENKLSNRQDLLTVLNVVDNAVVGPDKDIYEAYASALRQSGSVQDAEALEGLTWAQLFYVSYAQGMCEVLDHDYNFRRAKQYHESPNWERVNVPLGNDEQFLKVFKCGGSSAMNREPRCRIWD